MSVRLRCDRRPIKEAELRKLRSKMAKKGGKKNGTCGSKFGIFFHGKNHEKPAPLQSFGTRAQDVFPGVAAGLARRRWGSEDEPTHSEMFWRPVCVYVRRKGRPLCVHV